MFRKFLTNLKEFRLKVFLVEARDWTRNFLFLAKELIAFILTLILYLIRLVLIKIFSMRLWRGVFGKVIFVTDMVVRKLIDRLGNRRENTVSRIDLIDLSFRNMMVKKTRTLVTVGGMSVGIGAIVFLVSIGYGLQKLVIRQIARLDEMKQADVRPQVGGKVKVDDKLLLAIKEVPGVNKVLPLISVVGRVNYQSSVSDMVVYGVTQDFLNESAIKPIRGKIFESNDLVAGLPVSVVEELVEEGKDPNILGYSVESESDEVEFSIDAEDWVRVRLKPGANEELLGFTRRTGAEMTGKRVVGGTYAEGENEWVLYSTPLWAKKTCEVDKDAGCEEGKYVPVVDTGGGQRVVEGYSAQTNLNIIVKEGGPAVLGVSTELGATDSGEFVYLASESAQMMKDQLIKKDLGSGATKLAVINRAAAKVLGINEEDVLGKKFLASFVITGNLLTKSDSRLESNPAEYTIVGLVPDDKTAVFYVPFADLKSLGVDVYSQTKVVVKDQSVLQKVRKQIESMGMQTTSVADTVAQVNSLFGILRMILLLLGMVALFVASLGMFNTLTVSLLERTREVGLMKAMGMKSSEVRELFLTESMIMGIIGGLGGIFMGYGLGKLVGLGLSFFSVIKGSGYVDVAYLPPAFLTIIIILSLVVGVITGIYPAKRATKISALNALRYE